MHAEGRSALISFLRSGELKSPHAVTGPQFPGETAVGWVTPSFQEGSLFFRNAKGEVFRLAWEEEAGARPSDAKTDRRRALPAGSYSLTGYRIIRRDANKVEWMLAGTGAKIQALQIEAGQERKVSVADNVAMQCRATRKGEKVQIQMSIQGEHHCGLTIYRAGRRIPVEYRVHQGDRQVADGRMNYG